MNVSVRTHGQGFQMLAGANTADPSLSQIDLLTSVDGLSWSMEQEGIVQTQSGMAAEFRRQTQSSLNGQVISDLAVTNCLSERQELNQTLQAARSWFLATVDQPSSQAVADGCYSNLSVSLNTVNKLNCENASIQTTINYMNACFTPLNPLLSQTVPAPYT